MAELACRHYGNFPQRRPTLLPRAAKQSAQFALEAIYRYFETDSNLPTTVVVPVHTTEQPGCTRFCGMQMEPSWSQQGEAKTATLSSEHLQRHNTLRGRDQSIAASLRRIRIHPEAQRILGNSIAIVCLERLTVQGQVDQLQTALQPVVALVRLPCQPCSQLQNVNVVVSSLEDHSQQNGFCQNIEESSKPRETSTPAKPAGPSGLEQSETTVPSWTEPYSPDPPKPARTWTEPYSPDPPKPAGPWTELSSPDPPKPAGPWTEPYSPDPPKPAGPWTEPYSPDPPKPARTWTEPYSPDPPKPAGPWTELSSPDPPKPAGPSGLEQSETAAPSWSEPYSPAAPKPAGPSVLEQSETTAPTWSELYSPDASPPTAQDLQQESGLNGESNLGPLYIHFESVWNVKTDSEQSDLDPEPELNLVLELDPESESSYLGSEQNMVIESDSESSNSGPEDNTVIISDPESSNSGSDDSVVIESDLESSNTGLEDSMVMELDPESRLINPEQNIALEVDPESESKCESKAEPACRDNTGDQCRQSCSLTQQGSVVSSQQSEHGDGIEEMESEDFCAVCLNGGELLCCDRCPKVYHLACHLPPLVSFPLGDWVCTLCRTDQDPAEACECENTHSYGGVKTPYTLSTRNQRRCEKLTLLLSCHMLSAPFHEPVSPLARNYYQTIKRPIDLSVIRRKLDKRNTLHYFTPEQFVDDVLLMFKNCATFNYPDSEVAQAGRNLEVFFLSKLREIFPDQTFPTASQDRMDTGWFNRKRKDNYRKKRHVFSGKRYYL